MIRILGIDPGPRITGFGIIETDGRRSRYLDSGCVRVEADQLAEKLRIIFDSIHQIVQQYEPRQMAIEKVFMHRNADSALKLGQARGAAICAVSTCGIEVSEYTPREIKQAIVGTGAAGKEQVQHMIQSLLALNATPQADAADALAVALCHANTQQHLIRLAGAGHFRRGRVI